MPDVSCTTIIGPVEEAFGDVVVGGGPEIVYETGHVEYLGDAWDVCVADG